MAEVCASCIGVEYGEMETRLKRAQPALLIRLVHIMSDSIGIGSSNGDSTNATQSTSSAFKRRRLSPPVSNVPNYTLDDDDDDTNVSTYVPIKKRREQLITKLASKHVGDALSGGLTKEKKLQHDVR